jgi:hypothetical protein
MTAIANKLKTKAIRKLLDFDPDSGAETVVDLQPGVTGKCLPLSAGISNFLAGLFHSVGTGTVTTFKIFVSDDADGATNAAVVVAHAIGSNPDAVGDTLWLEVTGEQIKAAMGAASAYIGVKVQLNTSTDECIVYVESHGRFAYDTLTADYVS